MPTSIELPIFESAMTAWRDALAARERMPMLFVIAFAVVVALDVVLFILGVLAGPGFFFSVLTLIYSIAQGFFLAPLAIAVHRFVLLGEVRDGYRLDPQDGRFQRFFTFSAALAVVLAFPHVVGHLLSGPFGPSFLGSLIQLILSICAIIVMIRNVILFPAVAIDAPGADWRNAMEDTKGHSWSVFLILLCVILPLAVVATVLVLIFALIPLIGWIAVLLIQSALAVFAVAATAAAASRMYTAYAGQLGRPLGMPVPATVLR
jgi:hypothetical protein